MGNDGMRRRVPQRSRARRWIAVLLVLGLLPTTGVLAEDDSQEATGGSEAWEEFLADRSDLYNQLAPPIVECFQRRDSLIDPLSPIFHGCLDWHSAVHAAYSHMAIYHRTGAHAYRHLVEEKVAPLGVSLVPAEHRYQQAKGLDLPLTENPYGFGWFLVLAREWELTTGGEDFREMADDAATAMVSWFSDRIERGDARRFILDAAHANYSWSLINLDIWARHTEDEALRETVRDLSAPLFDTYLDDVCPADRDTADNRGGFQPTCLMRLAALAHVWGDQVDDWVAERLPADLHVPPVTEPANCHAGGQNFARAFALYQLHHLTGEESYRDNYAELVRYHVGRPDLYTDPDYLGDPGYLCYSHWVAQFGVRTISLSYEDRPSTPAVAPPGLEGPTQGSAPETGVAPPTWSERPPYEQRRPSGP